MSLSSEEIGNTTLAAGTAMDKIFGTPIAGKILVISGILGILTSWVALYIGATRLLYSMARVGMLPKVFAKLHPKYKTPYIATYVVGITTFIAPFFGYQALQWLSNAGGWAINFGLGMAALSFLVLRFKEPDMERPYRVPCGKLIGLLAVIMSFTLIIICFPGVSSFSLVWPYEAVIVIGWLLIGIILFIFTNRTGSFREVNPKMKALMFDTHEDSGNDSV
ncbi:APC family permease [Ruminococcus sp. CLA-AA-H200]|uniref:APC family permease n=1 Tax=Ruminococcus turbiniformis TaxID=2881258 RepID=A0ABS8G0W3_9FIRM|nr:APC family permease [Ruminococcus turbiniformis]MCC2255857.1 APC family permease [Ruminococcus turbiniformis]